MRTQNIIASIEVYIQTYPLDIQKYLISILEIIRSNAPGAEESISYGMPAFRIHGKPLVYFAAYPKHIGFYATPTGHSQFAKELSQYQQGKGSVQFPIDQPIPLDLIGRIVVFRVEENLAKSTKRG